MSYPISHSMADAYMSCQKKYEYAHIDKLMPLTTPEALARGTYGHKVLETYFLAIKDGESPEQAKSIAFLNAMDTPRYFNKIWNRIERFLDVELPTYGWEEILAVEYTNAIEIGPGIRFPFTVDLVVRLQSGEVKAIDFKFGADAYSDEMLGLYPQLPKYVGALTILAARNDLPFDPPTLAGYVFIRSRHNIANPDLFVESADVHITKQRVTNAFLEQRAASGAILAHQEMGVSYPRSFTNNCKYCPFIDLCVAHMNGRPEEEYETMKQVLFQPNTYGYVDGVD